jgi:hypothetical protein
MGIEGDSGWRYHKRLTARSPGKPDELDQIAGLTPFS